MASAREAPPPAAGNGVILENILLFGRVLRGLGLDVHVGRMLDAVRVLEDVGLSRRGDVRAALRTLLVHRRDDLPVFDEAFDVFWRQRKEGTSRLDLRSMGEQRRIRRVETGPPPLAANEGPDGAAPEGAAGDEVALTGAFSAREVLRTRDFAEYTPQEEAQARLLLASLQWRPGLRRGRRLRPGDGSALDLRRTLRANARSGGEPLRLMRRTRKEKPRRLVLICDVSGSMERYTRMLLLFAHSLYGGLDNHVEAFLFATRLTRVTRRLRQRDVDRAVADVARDVPDWSGGTRIGAALAEFNLRWARRTLGWGSIVLIVSDGWDRGDAELLGREMARLQRSCRRLIWLNPLAGSEGYEPLTQGMRAAAPYVDDLLPVHNLASLDRLAELLNALPQHRPPRRQRPGALPAADSDAPPQEAPSGAGQRSRHTGANPTFRHPLWGRGS